ncbi:MAG: NUDIX hydrolase [Spirochaetia bacterium]
MKQTEYSDEYSNDEWFDVVTPEGKPISKAPRGLCHGNPHLLHQVVHVHVFNSKGELWLQKRGMNKKIQPGKWDTSVGGHVAHKESIETALDREIREELGVAKTDTAPLFRYIMKNTIESELVYTHKMVHNGPFHPPEDEIETGRFWSIQEINDNLGKQIFTPNFEQEFNMLTKSGIVSPPA